MTKIGWIRIELLEDENCKYRVFGYDDLLMTDDLPEAISFATKQMLIMEQVNDMLHTLPADIVIKLEFSR